MGFVVKKVFDIKRNEQTGKKESKMRLRPDGTPAWRLIYEDRRKDRPTGTAREQTIHQDELEKYGLSPLDNIDGARRVAEHLNSLENLKRRDERVKLSAIKREASEEKVKSAYLPTDLVVEFHANVLLKRMAGDKETLFRNKLNYHWLFCRKMIAELQIEPQNYADESKQFYRYFERKAVSPDYAVKILRLLNAWGHFYMKKKGGGGIEPVKLPRGKDRETIARAYTAKKNYRGASDHLTPKELYDAETRLDDTAAYNWLYLSVWLGTRPEETDNLKNKDGSAWYITHEQGTAIVWVFQPKLTSVHQSKAWKPIPLITKEQRKCLDILESGLIKRPLNKTLRRVFTEKRITCYSGRKGFTDLMLSLGQVLEDISVFLGHQSIETTWKFYKQKQNVRFKKVA